MSTNLPKRLARKLAALPPEARELSNLRPHTEAVVSPETRAALSGPHARATATKARRAAMLACGCRLCALALNPPQTFAEYERLGLGEIGREYRAAESERAGIVARLEAERTASRAAREAAEDRIRGERRAAAALAVIEDERRYLERRELERKLTEARRINARLKFRAKCMGAV